MHAPILSYTKRATLCTAPLAVKLFQLLDNKKTNLALSADVTSSQALLALADQLGPEICLLKTHIDIIEDFSPALPKALIKLAQKHNFLIFEDRKFADIGHTVKHQYENGIYHIADWADIINAHTIPGPGVIQGLAEVGRQKYRGLLLIAEMSSAGHLMDQPYIQHTLSMAEAFPDFVMGFITQHAYDPKWIHIMPGIQFNETSDKLSQQYITPEKAILENGADIIIVGRGILAAKNPLIAAQEYRKVGWELYSKRC